MSDSPTRRSVLTGTLVVAVGAVVGYAVTRRTDAVQASAAAGANGYGPGAGGGSAAAGRPVAELADLPDGGGLVLADQHVVLVREGDQVHGLSATCTHQGCTVGPPAGGQVVCPCHGSVFDATTGDVVTGPASSPLPAVPVEVRDGAVYLSGGG
jgi:nitrite reductase/ring-hydroxylating ferredoxin subunit